MRACDYPLTAAVLVGAIGAVLLAVAEQAALHAQGVAAREEALLADRLVGVQQRLDLALLVLQLAVLDGVLPVARLLLNVEEQTGRTANRLQTLWQKKETSVQTSVSAVLQADVSAQPARKSL